MRQSFAVSCSVWPKKQIEPNPCVLQWIDRRHSRDRVIIMNELTITLVGRSGVGKSSLINALLGPTPSESHKLTAPVSRTPALFVDTPGLDDFGAASTRSDPVIEAALDRSDLILFVVDSSARSNYQDRVIAERLHHLGKPVILVINKIDMLPSGVNIENFSELGFETSVQISVRENLNIAALSHLIAAGGTSRVDQECLLVRRLCHRRCTRGQSCRGSGRSLSRPERPPSAIQT